MSLSYTTKSREEQEKKFKWLHDNTDVNIYYYEYTRNARWSFSDDKEGHFNEYPSIIFDYNLICGSGTVHDGTWNEFLNGLKRKGFKVNIGIKPIKELTKHKMYDK